MRYLLTLIGLLLLPTAATAQIEVEARGGVAIGSHSTTFAGLDLQPRPSTELLVKLNWKGLKIFGSGSFSMFGCDQAFCEGPSTITVYHTAGIGGVEYSRWGGWLRAGAGYGLSRIRTDSSGGLAFMTAAGIRIRLAKLSILPGLSIRRQDGAGRYTAVLGMDLGLTYELGGR